MTELCLSYKRVGETFEGTLAVEAFTGLSFADMMRSASRKLAEAPEATLVLQRTDRAGLTSVAMEPALRALLLTDPEEYIRIHSPPARRVVVHGEAGLRPSRTAVPLLRAGYDTLAAAFGDVVYLRWRNGRVESPDTGRWERVGVVEARLGVKFELVPMHDTELSGWALLATSALLQLAQPLFYLPRPWNAHGGWIQRHQLDELYQHYVEEKIQCLLEAQ